MSDSSLKLSICIPTHHGRGWCLREALDSIVADVQSSALEGVVEVCISDNASHDETADIVAAAQERMPGLITYCRMPVNAGIYSWFNVIEMARGEYCWLFGSDDVLEPGAIRAALERLTRYHGCAGMTAAYVHYDFHLQHKLPMHPETYYPDDYDQERLITGFDDCLYQLGMAQGFMSVQIFRRQLWLDAVNAESPDFIHYCWHYTHAYLLARMMQREPAWLWAPFTAVMMRSDNGEVPQRLGAKTYLVPLGYLRDMASLWSRVCSGNRSLYQRLMTKCMRIAWSPTVVRHLKQNASYTSADDAVLLAGFTRYLWPLPQFWLRTFPALLVPHWFWKALLHAPGYSAVKARLRSLRPSARARGA